MPVDWYERDVLLKIEGATDEALTELAFQGEALAKVNIQANGQIDTGFMLNSVYGIGAGQDHREQVWQDGPYKSRKTGEVATHRSAPQPAGVERGQAAIHAAAEYAVYLELANSFLYRAVEQLQEQAGGIIEDVARRKGL